MQCHVMPSVGLLKSLITALSTSKATTSIRQAYVNKEFKYPDCHPLVKSSKPTDENIKGNSAARRGPLCLMDDPLDKYNVAET